MATIKFKNGDNWRTVLTVHDLVDNFSVSATNSNTTNPGLSWQMNDGNRWLMYWNNTSDYPRLTLYDQQQSKSLASLYNPYPIGAVYLATSSTSPGSRFGGTWTQMGTGADGDPARVLRFASNTSTGGADSTTLAIANLPKTMGNMAWMGWESIQDDNPWTGIYKYNSKKINMYAGTSTTGQKIGGVTVSSGGSGTAISRLPAYKNFYAWVRTA